MRHSTGSHRTSFRPPDTYLKRVKEFPLRPLRTETEYSAAVEILGQLAMQEDPDGGTRDYATALSRFVGDYEEKRFSLRAAKMSPLEAVEFLMAANDMTPTDLAEIFGSRGIASEVLHGKRGLSKAMIRKLAERFAVDPGLFL